MLQVMRWVSLATWLGLLGVAFFTAPAGDPNQNEVTIKLLTFQLDGINRSFVALFNLMGVWPLLFIVMLGFDTTEQRVWRWPFLLGSFVLGAFALLPYLVLRRWGAPKRAPTAKWLRVLGSRPFAVMLLLGGVAMSAWFIVGDLAAFARLFRANQFAYVMSFDFIACTVAGVLLCIEDASVRTGASSWAWSIGSAVGFAFRLVQSPLAPKASR